MLPRVEIVVLTLVTDNSTLMDMSSQPSTAMAVTVETSTDLSTETVR